MASPTAAQRVLAITELLEGILKLTPGKTILTSQRVSREWRKVVKNSIALQRALFLAPISAEMIRLWMACEVDCDFYSEWHQYPSEDNKIAVALNPFLSTVIGHVSNEVIFDDDMFKHVWCSGNDAHTTNNPAMDYPEASWRKMFFTQPPCFEIGALMIPGDDDFLLEPPPLKTYLSNPGKSALTMEELTEALCNTMTKLAEYSDYPDYGPAFLFCWKFNNWETWNLDPRKPFVEYDISALGRPVLDTNVV